MAVAVCPIHGERMTLEQTTNAAGDPIERYICPLGTFATPWSNEALWMAMRQVNSISNFPMDDTLGALKITGVGVGGGGGADPVGIKDGTNATQKLAVDANGRIGINNFPATPSPLGPMTWVSLKSAAPAANAVQADTGALSAGDYEFVIHLAAADTLAVGKGLVVEHRNAANSATTNVLGGCPASSSLRLEIPRMTLAANERIRVIAGTAAGAASSMYISAIGRRLAT